MIRSRLHPIRAPFLATVLLLAACGVLPSSYDLHASNNTTLTLDLVVNERVVGTIEPGRSLTLGRHDLPALPWDVDARTSTGRVLTSMAVAEGSVRDDRALDGTGGYSAPAGGVGLSCGTFSMYVGDMAPIGGGPTVGQPGDCEP